MPPQVLKKQCKRCLKNFLTYEVDKDFCNDDCKGKYRYMEFLGVNPIPEKTMKNCLFCGDETQAKFCNVQCRRGFQKRERVKNSANLFIKDSKKGNPNRLPYEVLNKIEEKKRVFEDAHWLYRRNRDRI